MLLRVCIMAVMCWNVHTFCECIAISIESMWLSRFGASVLKKHLVGVCGVRANRELFNERNLPLSLSHF